MIQATEPITTAKIQNAPELIRSITEPETIEAAVHENNRKAAQKTPVILSPRFGPMVGDQGVFAAAAAVSSPPVIKGPFGNAQYSHHPKKKKVTVTKGMIIEFFISVCI